MTLPQGGRAITNRFAGRCQTCRQSVDVEQGAALRDDINHTKWATFHLACLPAPYEQADVKPHSSGPYFKPHYRPTNTAVAATPTTVHSINISLPTSMQPQPYAVVATGLSTQTERAALKAGRGTSERLIVFYGPMPNPTGAHLDVSVDNVLVLHGMADWVPDCTILTFGPDTKQDYRPGPEDFVIGPRQTSDEYRQAKEALAMWLVQKGITR